MSILHNPYTSLDKGCNWYGESRYWAIRYFSGGVLVLSNILTTVILVIGNMHRYFQKSALGQENVILELIYAHILGPRTEHHVRFDVFPLSTDFGRNFIIFSSSTFRKSTSSPSKMNQNRCFEGAFKHPEAQPIYRDILGCVPKVISYWVTIRRMPQ